VRGAHDPAELRKLVALRGGKSTNGEGAPADANADEGLDRRPRIDAKRDDYANLARECWDALTQSNDPPRLFIDSEGPIRLEENPTTGSVRSMPLTEDRMLFELGSAVHWYRTVLIGQMPIEKESSPKPALAKQMLASPAIPFPVLERIVRAPIFGADGSLQTTAGYHAANRTYFDGEGLAIPQVSPKPSAAEFERAYDLIFREFLVDFPFVKPSDAAHALAELLLPFVRAMIPGPCPLHVHEAPMQGTGKDLLAEVMCRVATGADPSTLTYAERSDEFAKRLVSTLRPLPEWTVIPNVTGKVDNDDLTDLISRGEYQGRLLGASTILRLPARNVWTMTSNNAQLSPDMARRSVRIRLDAQSDRPEERSAFQHPELKAWTDANRGELIWACLTLVQSWIAAGKPPGTATLGGFNAWAKTMGGIVAHADVEGFLGDREFFLEQADVGTADERAFVSMWWDKWGPASTGVAALFEIANDDDINLPIEAPTGKGQRTRLGMLLRRMRDRRYRTEDGTIVTVTDEGVSHNARAWKLKRDEAA
jgi:hypothetical protein